MSGKHESLIHVETDNLYKVPRVDGFDDGEGYIMQLGADNGANILIENSKFTYSRFCKGLIVYRPGTDY